MAGFSVRAMSVPGVSEFTGVNTVSSVDTKDTIVGALLRTLKPTFLAGTPQIAHYNFTSNGANSRACMDRTKDAIEAAGLGDCMITERAVNNPNTGNPIHAMIWTPNRPALIKAVQDLKL